MRIIRPSITSGFPAGSGTSASTVNLTAPCTAVALTEVTATSVRLEIIAGGTAIYDQTTMTSGRRTITFEGLPTAATAQARITLAAGSGVSVSAAMVLAGSVFELGVVETKPTIGITDYSRRDTDAFGVTTVVQRAWARKLSLKFQVARALIDATQAQLAAVRAKLCLWIVDDRFDSLMVYGLYKDFSLDLQLLNVSYFSMAIEGLPDTDTVEIDGSDPAPTSGAGRLRVVLPATVNDGVLQSSSVAEADYPAWAAGTAYAVNQYVIRGHRRYQAITATTGVDPALGDETKWLDIGPTNRWAMFDQAQGTVTAAVGSIVIVVKPGSPVSALALLDVVGATVRVQSPGYDRTIAIATTAAMFLDLAVAAGAQITVTIAGATGSAPVSVGTFVMGLLRSIGLIEDSPTLGLTDYSRKDTDAFGNVTIIERAWSKKMSAKTLISTTKIDTALRRVASIRAQPVLWLGADGFDVATIYGFYRDFSIEVDQNTSACSLTIEGLSTAAPPPVPLSTDWPSIGDPDGTKPGDVINGVLQNTADNTLHVYDRLAQQVAADADQQALNILAEITTGGIWRANSDQILYMPDGTTVRVAISQTKIILDQHSAYFNDLLSLDSNGRAKRVLAVNADGSITGVELLAGGGDVSSLRFIASQFVFVDNSGANPVVAFIYDQGVLKMHAVEVDTIKAGSITTSNIVSNAVTKTVSFGTTAAIDGSGSPNGPTQTVASFNLVLTAPAMVQLLLIGSQAYSGNADYGLAMTVDGAVYCENSAGVGYPTACPIGGGVVSLAAGTHALAIAWRGSAGNRLKQATAILSVSYNG